ncbi:MAG TPA: hypothetical protein PLR35_17410, partial [Burkholderiaceae bacterium]|nr:hypothetical protein [Burkholderiaceae bacterium]
MQAVRVARRTENPDNARFPKTGPWSRQTDIPAHPSTGRPTLRQSMKQGIHPEYREVVFQDMQ